MIHVIQIRMSFIVMVNVLVGYIENALPCFSLIANTVFTLSVMNNNQVWNHAVTFWVYIYINIINLYCHLYGCPFT